MKDFSIETQWKLYLNKTGLQESRMHPVQLQETKKAFYACAGSLLVLFKDGLTDLAIKEGDDAAVTAMENMLKETREFWKKQL